MKETTNIIKKVSLALTVFMATAVFNQAQAQEVTVYGYCYAYNYDMKVLYVTNIVNGVQKSDQYFDASPTDLKNQWNDKFKTIVSESYKYTLIINSSAFLGEAVSDYDSVDEDRTKQIGEYKQKGFSIHYVTDFRYRKGKRN